MSCNTRTGLPNVSSLAFCYFQRHYINNTNGERYYMVKGSFKLNIKAVYLRILDTAFIPLLARFSYFRKKKSSTSFWIPFFPLPNYSSKCSFYSMFCVFLLLNILGLLSFQTEWIVTNFNIFFLIYFFPGKPS